MGKYKKLTPAQWDAIRRCWEFDPDEPTLVAAANRTAVKIGFDPPAKTTLYVRAEKEGWERRGGLAGVVQAAHRKADRMSQPDGQIAPAPAVANARRQDAAEEAYQQKQESEDKRASVLARHRQEWHQVAALRQESVKVRNTSPRDADRLATLAKRTAETTKIQQDGERKAWGLDELYIPDFSKKTDDELRAIIEGK